MAIVYIETSIIGYLTARSRNDVIFQARQELTRSWWESSREDYELVTSQLVLDEVGAGDADAAAERLQLLIGMPLLALSDDQVDSLADALLSAHLLPAKALGWRRNAGHSLCLISVATLKRKGVCNGQEGNQQEASCA
jgi:hypothetical protein